MAQGTLKKFVGRPFTTERTLHEVVELTEKCELGDEGERAIVIDLAGKYMTLMFVNRAAKFQREVNTGADYKFLKSV